MTDIWTPSDALLEKDPIARAKVAHPFDAPGLHAPAGDEDDAANAQAAAVVLAEARGDQPADGFDGHAADDDEIDDHDDTTPIGDDI